MRRLEWKKKYLKAFKMYLQGESYQEIADKLDIAVRTVWRWVDKGDWKAQFDKTIQDAVQKTQFDVTEEKIRSLKLIKAAESYWAKKMQEGELEPNFNDLANLQRAKWDILAPKQLNQMNILNANPNGPTYSFEIVKPEKKAEHEI